MSLGQGNLLNNRYRIVDILGRGGMGAVYRAVDESLGVDVAVKENLFTTDDYARQFRMEAQILAGMRHPNLPRVTDHFVLDGQGQYLVMDYIEGDDLRQRIEKQGTLNEVEAIRIGAAVCDALTYLHTRKPPILHRDIKLGNVKLTPDGNVILVDFGLAKMAWEHEETMTGARAMTPGYSPPEQYGSARTDARSDIYSLGATLYAAITGVVPEDSLMRAVDGVVLTPLRKHKPVITPRLAGVIEKAMEPSPTNRYQSADEFKSALLGLDQETGRLESLEDGEQAPRSVPKAEAKPRRKRQSFLGLFLLVLVSTLTVFGMILLDPKNQQFVLSFLQPTATPTHTLTPTSTHTQFFTPTETQAVTPTVSVTPTRLKTKTAIPTSTFLPSPTTLPTEVVSVMTPDIIQTETVMPSPTSVGGGSGEISFAMAENRYVQIYLANPDGSNLRPLTSHINGACNFDWSPDATQLVFVSPCNAKAAQYPEAGLYLFDLASGIANPILEKSTGEFDPAWSPDGAKIAFTSMRDGTWQIYVYNLETAELTQLTTAEGNLQSRYPAWSPDGAKLVYTVRKLGAFQIWTMNADGSDQLRLVMNGNGVSDYLPAWSKDGTFILFSETNFDLTAPSVLMRLNIGMERAERLLAAGEAVVDVSFSQDGIWVAYESTDGTNQDIYLLNLLDGTRQRLTSSENAEFDPVWKP